MPLELFDNTDYERYSPEKWVKTGGKKGARARAKFFTGEQWEWLPCHVLAWNAETQLFTVAFSKTDVKFLKRLSILFDEDDKVKFEV